MLAAPAMAGTLQRGLHTGKGFSDQLLKGADRLVMQTAAALQLNPSLQPVWKTDYCDWCEKEHGERQGGVCQCTKCSQAEGRVPGIYQGTGLARHACRLLLCVISTSLWLYGTARQPQMVQRWHACRYTPGVAVADLDSVQLEGLWSSTFWVMSISSQRRGVGSRPCPTTSRPAVQQTSPGSRAPSSGSWAWLEWPGATNQLSAELVSWSGWS